MSEDAEIRRHNLRLLGLTAPQLKAQVGNSYQYWRDMLDGKKSFGEKAARKIETKLTLTRGCLDDIDGCTKKVKPVGELSKDALFVGSRLDEIDDQKIKHDAMIMTLQVLQTHYRTWKDGMAPVEEDPPKQQRSHTPPASHRSRK